jgi:anti-sigma regulatory factor (Ser/Thr protein kinase)
LPEAPFSLEFRLRAEGLVRQLQSSLEQRGGDAEDKQLRWPSELQPAASGQDVTAWQRIVSSATSGDITDLFNCETGGVGQLTGSDRIADVTGILELVTGTNVRFLALTSRDLYQTEIAEDLLDRLSCWPANDSDDAALRRTVLVELLQNAIVHGNLELASGDVSSIDDFVDLSRRIGLRLADNRYGLRLVTICFWLDNEDPVISIMDQGKGFEHHRRDDDDHQGDSRYSGRGLNIIETFSKEHYVDMSGRRTTVRF